jgi:serine kinase of HPr protein (carbohydrate metabolism regulator)
MQDDHGELIHASAVIVGDRGIIIRGDSGSGKSSIVSALMDRAGYRGVFSVLVSDDQCRIRDEAGRLLCTAPAALRGGLEIRGSGLHQSDFEERAVIHLVVDLVEPNQSVRFSENAVTVLHGVAIAHLVLPKSGIETACQAIESRLFRPVWKK